jgi:tetratricopeptide (TPR) repeat protein
MKKFGWIFVALFALAACKEKASSKRHSEIPINQKIDGLIKEAAAATDDNKKAAAYGEVSELFIDKGDFRQAMLMARLGEKANPTQKQCLASIAEAQISEGKLAEAAVTLKDVLQRHPTYGRAHFVQGNLSASNGDLTGALKSYAAAEKEKFNDPRLLINMGGVSLKAKKNGDAVKIYQRAIAANAELAEAYLGAGIASQKANKKAEAKKYFEKYVALAPNSSEASRVKIWLKAL